jgi:hypothetical protein
MGKSLLLYRSSVCILSLTCLCCCLAGSPFPCGGWSDITIFRHAIIHCLEEYERVEADNGYEGEAPRYVKTPAGATRPEGEKEMRNRVRGRHETVNERFKNWGCLSQRFRSKNMLKFSACFRAVAVMTQLAIECGEPLFPVGDDYR